MMIKKLKLAALSGFCAIACSPVFAQVVAADPFDAALSTATGKIAGYAAALVGVAAISVVYMIAIKYVKKIPRAG